MISKLKIACIALGLGLAGSASAIPVVDLLGDKDCFGTGGACIEDGVTNIPGLWGGEVQTGTDPVFTDFRYATSATTSWTHTFAAAAYTTASLTIFTAGIADIAGPYTIFVDGVSVGSMPLDGFGHILAETFTFAVPTGLVADGSATVSFTSGASDSWAIDYSELTLDDVAAVTSPATLALLGLGLVGLAMARRKRPSHG